MRRTFRYPLHPTVEQEETLVGWLGYCQQLYNAALQERRESWKQEKSRRDRIDAYGGEWRPRKLPTYESQSAELTQLRATDVEAKAVPVEIERSALRQVDRAYEDFFERRKRGENAGAPRFRAWDRYNSIAINNGAKVLVIDDDRRGSRSARIRIPKLGEVRFHEYRPLHGKIMATTIKRSAGRWYVCFVCDLGDAPTKIAIRNAVGIDVGLTTFATLTDGAEVPNPRYSRVGANQLAERQRSVGRKQRGSNGHKRAKSLVTRAHEHVHNQRLDHGRKLAAVIVAKYDLIAYEDLIIRGIAHGNFAKSIFDAAWGSFIHALICKAEYAGKWTVPVDPRGTSQRCSSCDHAVKKDLSVRTHSCDQCGLVLGRDLNAAQNILALGRSAVAGIA